MPGYYAQKLAAERLMACYEIASPEVKAYLNAEIDHVISRLSPSDIVLELGCGYGRVLKKIADQAKSICGIDTSLSSLKMARGYLNDIPCHLAAMDAIPLGFPNRTFDTVICIQNGISAFGVNQSSLIKEAMRVTRPGGKVLFSSYAESFWQYRLQWFEAQSAKGLLGEIDYNATGNGVIVCKDGFKATTVTPESFSKLAKEIGVIAVITKVAKSSVFMEIVVQ